LIAIFILAYPCSSVCRPACLSCSAVTCRRCSPNYYINGRNCSQCSNKPNCANCNGYTCIMCDFGYYLSATSSCLTCQTSSNCTNCVYTSSAVHCTLCSSGYFVNSTTYLCDFCNLYLSGCATCLNKSVCSSCNSSTLYLNATFRC
jgi:hypothetical protein